jgi:hypothetical protein
MEPEMDTAFTPKLSRKMGSRTRKTSLHGHGFREGLSQQWNAELAQAIAKLVRLEVWL